MDSADHSISRPTDDPAADAAAMLLRLGFAILAIVIPSATLMSRWVIVVLVPIAAVLIILSSILRGNPFRVVKSLVEDLQTIPGLTAFFVALWAVASLGWTGAPDVAGVKIFKTLGVILLGVLAVRALPRRMRATNLHLITIGVALGAVLIIATAVAEMTGSGYLRFAAATPGRSAVLLACLGWAAAAWLLIKNRRVLAALLIAMVFAAALLGPTREAILPVGVGLIVFALAWAVPERAGRILAVVAAAVILAAPLIPLLAKLATGVFGQNGTLASIALWWNLTLADPVALLTGRGYDAADAARDALTTPSRLPSNLITDIWYDLGAIGAIGFAILVFHMFRAAGRFGLEMAPLALAGLASAFAFTLVERGATQTWWLNSATVFAIVLLSVERGRYRTVRPRATMTRRAGDDPGTQPKAA